MEMQIRKVFFNKRLKRWKTSSKFRERRKLADQHKGLKAEVKTQKTKLTQM